METVKRKDGTLRFRESYYHNHKKINGPYFKRKTDAKAWKIKGEAEKNTRLIHGDSYAPQVEINFKEYAESWLSNHVQVNCAQKTNQAYISILKIHLYPRFEHLKLTELTEVHGMELMKELKRTHKPKGIKNIWIVLKAIINRARKDRLIIYDPFEFIQKPKADLGQDKFWIKDEITQFLLANHKDVLYPFYFTAIHTGLRLAEICGLKWDRVDFVTNQISVTRTRDKFGLKDSTKTKLKRIVPMTQELRLILLKLHQQTKSPFVFLENDGSEVKYSHIYRRFQKAQTKAGIFNKIKFHDLRHSFASNYMMNGGNVFDLQKLLGHTDIIMTMRYAHFTPNHLQNSLQFMNMVQDEKISIPVLDPQGFKSEENLLMLGT